MNTVTEAGESPDQLIVLIKFGLADLSSRNAHFDFEELCRHVARSRICTNVVPATGPVGVGGDQGRDFETFRSYLRDELGENGGFLGLVSEGPLAFACSTQRDSVAGKIRADVRKIMGIGQPVQGIFAFTTSDIPVATRHGLIDEVADEYGVGLQILDGRAIAEQLADSDTYWIAERYLSMPSGIRPPAASDQNSPPEWYIQLRDEWRELGDPLPTLGDALDIREGLRRATFHYDTRTDLPFWLDVARGLLVEGAPGYVKQRARYDIAVATLRGTRTLRPVDGLVREMFTAAAEDDHPMRLLDASVLLMYATGASTRGITDISPEELKATNQRLHSRVTSLMQTPTTRLTRARLLYVAGHLSLQPDLTAFDTVPLVESQNPDVADYFDDDGRFNPPPIEFGDAAPPLMIDLQGGLESWMDLADLLPDLPMFEVEEWGRMLVFMTPILSSEPAWLNLVGAVDTAVAKVAGGSASASLCRDRALALANRGRHVDAIRELHGAKIGWWSGDTVRGSLLAMLLLARSYVELRMFLAAKQHALGVAMIASGLDAEDLSDLIPAAIFVAADADYQAGAWCGASELYEIGLMLHSQLVEHGLDLEHPAVTAAVFHLMMMIDASLVCAGPLRPLLTQMASDLGLADVAEATLAEAPRRTSDDWTAETVAEGMGPPFLDAGPSRTIRFAALGTGWKIECSNTANEVSAAERLAAAAQIVLVELAMYDLALIPTSIEIDVEVATDARDADLINKPDNDCRSWTVVLSPVDPDSPPDLDAISIELLTVLMAILSDASLLPTTDFESMIEEAFQHGLSHKLTAGRTYDELVSIVSAERFNETARRDLSPSSASAFIFLPPDGVSWRRGPGPTFSEATARELLMSRYENLDGAFDRTLESLRADGEFLNVVIVLRRRGWLDWHILTAIFNITLNHRLDPAQHFDWRDGLETEASEPVPTSLFTLDAMEFARQLSMMSLLKHWGLELRQETPNTRAIESFLADRYGYWRDDVEHQDPFPDLRCE